MPRHTQSAQQLPERTMQALATTRVVSATSLSACAEHRGMIRPVLPAAVRTAGARRLAGRVAPRVACGVGGVAAPTRHHSGSRPPNYGLRRLVAGAVVAVVVAVGAVVGATVAVGVLGGFGAAPAVASGDVGSPPAAGVHVARPGDTMWSIAATHRGDIAHDRYLDALVRRNATASIQAGQAIWLP